MELPFAALHQLCVPMLDQLGCLPAPQRNALTVTFGLGEGPVPDRLFVGLATLGLLSEVAGECPLVCLIDDAQWMDKASAQVLGFASRRLLAESVVIVFAAREPPRELHGLPELAVEGLAQADARELLGSVVHWPLDERVAEQLVAEACGNPLALLELPQELSQSQLAGGFGLLGAAMPSGRIEDSFLRRLAALPEDSRRLLLVVAADPTGDLALVWRAGLRLGIGASALEPAQEAGLIQVGSSVWFRHTLVRSAVYGAAPAEARRDAHMALANATDPQTDPDRRAWHLAAAAAEPDEQVAAELERAADRALARGGLAAAAAFLERATELTLEGQRRAERALAAARAKYEAGLLEDALALLAVAAGGASDELGRARAYLLRAQIAFASRRVSEAPSLLLDAARRLESLDPGLARETYLEAVSAASYVGRLARRTGIVEASRAALGAPPAPWPPRPPDLLLEGLATWFTEGYAAGAQVLKQALSAFRREVVLPQREARWLGLAAHAASDFWDDETWALVSERQVERDREAGALTAKSLNIANRMVIVAISGELVEATSLFEEMRAVGDATGIEVPVYSALRLAALRGREAETSELIETAVADAVARGEGIALMVAESTRALLYNGLGRYDAALSAIRGVADRPYELGSTRALPELIEAAVRVGELHLAAVALTRLTETTAASGTDWARGMEARSRALLSSGDAADSLYREAIELLGRTRVRLELARAHLLYGEWLRSEERRPDAREQLRSAHEMFTTMGVTAFAERAERELLGTGERVRKGIVEIRDDLTPHEAQIARLARDGLSNPEIGERLFISPRTVEYHLHKVFTKLAISSRNELQGALPEEEPVAELTV
jgi:DNA-binding CsgD family transcriptional regulator